MFAQWEKKGTNISFVCYLAKADEGAEQELCTVVFHSFFKPFLLRNPLFKEMQGKFLFTVVFGENI